MDAMPSRYRSPRIGLAPPSIDVSYTSVAPAWPIVTAGRPGRRSRVWSRRRPDAPENTVVSALVRNEIASRPADSSIRCARLNGYIKSPVASWWICSEMSDSRTIVGVPLPLTAVCRTVLETPVAVGICAPATPHVHRARRFR